MNRLTASGLLVEASLRPGLRVIVACHQAGVARQEFGELVDVANSPMYCDLVDRVDRANGAQQIRLRNGSSLRTVGPRGLRGRAADLVFLDVFADGVPGLTEDALRVVDGVPGGEVVRA